MRLACILGWDVEVSPYLVFCRSRRLVVRIACSIDGFGRWPGHRSTILLTRDQNKRGTLVFLAGCAAVSRSSFAALGSFLFILR